MQCLWKYSQLESISLSTQTFFFYILPIKLGLDSVTARVDNYSDLLCRGMLMSYQAYLIERKIQPLQNLCPQLVCTGSRSPKRQIGHSYLLSNGGSKYSSYPSDLGSSDDENSPLENTLTELGSNEGSSRERKDCSTR